MDGVGRFITCFHSSNMGIVALFYHAGFFAVGNSLIDGLCNIGSRGESIARLSSINRTVRTCCQCRFIDIERNGAVFVFGGRTCAINEVQRGIVFSQGFSIRAVDLYADVLQCAVGFCQRGFGFVRQIQFVGSDIGGCIFRRRKFQTIYTTVERNGCTFGVDGVNRMTVSRVIGFGYAGNIRTPLNLGFRSFNLFEACCVGISHAVGNVGNLVAAVGESARSQAHWVAA